MSGPVLLVAGVVALAAGLLLLQRGGSGYRVGRTLAAAPQLSLDEAIAAVASGQERYIRTSGRVSSDEEFPDENDRPLVYRRQRIQRAAGGGRWQDLDDERLAVPFGLEIRGSFLALDVDALGDGLVVVPRVGEGLARDLPEAIAGRLPPLDPAVPVRLLIEQLSAVEQATAAGVPRLGQDGRPILSAGLGRPLIVTSLEPAAAMRVLAAGRRGAIRLAAGLLVGGLACLAVGLVVTLLGQ